MNIKPIFSKKNKVLLTELVRTDFKLRYQGSVLGYAWSLLRPLLLFVILYVVFVKFLKLGNDVPHFPVYLLLGIVLWNFFAEMTSLSLTSIVARGDLIRKIRIPRWIIVMSSSVTALINLGLNLIIVMIFMLINHVEPMNSMLLLPLALLQLYLFAVGVSLILATSYVSYRDVSHIWEVIMQGLFYLTPILYPLSRIVNPLYQKVILSSPIAAALQDARYSTVTHYSPTISSVYGTQWSRLIPYIITVITLMVGVLYFKIRAKDFAEDL